MLFFDFIWPQSILFYTSIRLAIVSVLSYNSDVLKHVSDLHFSVKNYIRDSTFNSFPCQIGQYIEFTPSLKYVDHIYTLLFKTFVKYNEYLYSTRTHSIDQMWQ